MKILFLVDEFYPSFGANSLLIKTLSKEFIKNGEQVFVMPFSCPKHAQAREDYQGITIVREQLNDGKDGLFSALKKGELLTAIKIAGKVFKQKFSNKQNVLLKDRIVARKLLEKFIKENQIDVVFSICCSIELSFPLLYLRKKGKLPCKWVFYMIDPFESHQYYRGIESVSKLRILQHDIMQNCDNVVSTKLIYNDTKEWETKEILDKISIIEFPKIEKIEENPCEDDIVLDKTKINVVCTGSKNEQVRNSNYTLNLCEKMKNENVLFHFIGRGWCDGEDEQKGNCRFYGLRSHQCVCNLQNQADYLLNIGNVVTNQLPSKVLEYISAGKPIINVVKSKNCSTIALLENYDAINLFESDDVQESLKTLNDFMFCTHKNIDFEEIEKQYKTYTPNFVVKQMLDICKGK